MNYSLPNKFSLESLRLEAVTVCVGFDDLLDLTLPLNHPHLDTMIVVTSHDDRATQQVAKKHGAICVQTELSIACRNWLIPAGIRPMMATKAKEMTPTARTTSTREKLAGLLRAVRCKPCL